MMPGGFYAAVSFDDDYFVDGGDQRGERPGEI